MIKTLLLPLISICMFVSCGSTRLMNEWNADKNMQKVKIGMTKDEIISHMGQTYKVMEAPETPDEYIEVLGYVDAKEGIYRLRLVNDELTEWDYIFPPAHRFRDNGTKE